MLLSTGLGRSLLGLSASFRLHSVKLGLPVTRSVLRLSLRRAPSIVRTAATESLAGKRYAYPEKLCIYHAGTGKIMFLACLKLSTIFIFILFGFIIAPKYYEKEGLSVSTARTALCAVVPLAFVAYITAPFVSFVHIRVPPFARQTDAMLRTYIKKLPASTELAVTTMSAIAKPRVSSVKISELRPASRRFGVVNYVRDTAPENATRKWYNFRAVGDFALQANSKPRVSWVWGEITSMIAKGQR